jgi:cytochrome c oxidase subunit 2
MVDSEVVLTGQTIAYSCYALVIMMLVGWFAYKVTKPGDGKNIIPNGLFYSFAGMLIVLGVSLHIVTYNTIPWVPMDLNRSEITADKVFKIEVKNHQFILPEEEMLIEVGDKVMFEVNSADLTYGFGLFREDNSMLFQMQVVPGHLNDILWQFTKPGVFSIRSTEYSGPKGAEMVVTDCVIVTDKK